jgi:hypothetical protein
MDIFPTQGHTTFHLRLREKHHNHLMGIFPMGTQCSIFVLERNDTPILWAHPTHGLSHRMTHLVCVLKDVSRSCNHQQYPAHGHLPHTGAHNVPSSSQRGTTHPTHGLSLRETHSVYVLEDVSRSCNHQHSILVLCHLNYGIREPSSSGKLIGTGTT